MCCCCCVLLLLFCIIFVDYYTIPRPLATIHRFTRLLRLLTDCYAVSMCFSSHMFNSSSQGECYFHFIQCFCPFWHQESGTVFYAAREKVFAGDLFSIFDNFSPLRAKKTTIASKHEDPDYGDLSMNQSRGAKIPFMGAKIPFTGAKISFMEVNKLRMECKKCQPRNGAMNDLPRETYPINFNKNKSDMTKYFCKQRKSLDLRSSFSAFVKAVPGSEFHNLTTLCNVDLPTLTHYA